MKYNNKFVLLPFLLFCFTCIYSQDAERTPYMAGFSIDLPITVGDFRKSHKLGYGFGFCYERGLSEKVAATISTAYVHFWGDDRELDNYPGVFQRYPGYTRFLYRWVQNIISMKFTMDFI
jgi:hypothetical protein